ncbi:lysosomal-trafficking regulator-like [Tubulanus polymorphus]|uniref:lysosomal-trafficking regulator-like n=1 Tax=Tubulanus polymorphus TaxID=672921 RepID=UPI003DA43796
MDLIEDGPAQKLKAAWDDYTKIPRDPMKEDQLRERSFKLDCFLKLFLQERLVVENVRSLHFSDMKSVCNILSREFLSDVHLCCNQTQDEDDVSDLQLYLLSDRGWMILQVLHLIGVDALSSNMELAGLLVSLIPLCCGFPTGEEDPVDCPLSSVDSFMFNTSCIVGDRVPNARCQERKDSITSSSLMTFRRQYHRRNHSINLASSSDSCSDDETAINEKPRRKRLQSNEKQYFSLRNSSEPVNQNQCLLLFEDSWRLDTVLNANGKLSSLELCMLMLELLKDLCLSDVQQQQINKQLAVAMLPTLLEVLSSIQSEELATTESGWSATSRSVLQRFIVRVILSLSVIISYHQSGYECLKTNGVLPMLLEVSEISLRRVDLHGSVKDADEFLKDWLIVQLCYEILEGLLLLLHYLLRNIHITTSSVTNALKLINDFEEHHGNAMLKILIDYTDSRLFAETIPDHVLCARVIVESRQIFRAISHLIYTLKSVKVEYIHSMKCLKRRHIHCELELYQSHHHSILGSPHYEYEKSFTSSASYGSYDDLCVHSVNSSVDKYLCAVASWGQILLNIYSGLKTKSIQLMLLHNLEISGLCCCIKPRVIIEYLLAEFETKPASTRTAVLRVIIILLLEHCKNNASESIEPCLTCSDGEKKFTSAAMKKIMKKPSLEKNFNGGSVDGDVFQCYDTTDSALSSSEADTEDMLESKWSCLKSFTDLIDCDVSNVSSQVTKHLLHLIRHGNHEIQQELFSRVLIPSINGAKKKFITDNSSGVLDDTNYHWHTVILHCLSALPVLLQSRTAQAIFHRYGCLQCISELLDIPSLQSSVLKIFEVLIILGDLTLHSEVKSELTRAVSMQDIDEISVEEAAPSLSKHHSIEHRTCVLSVNAFIDILYRQLELDSTNFDNCNSHDTNDDPAQDYAAITRLRSASTKSVSAPIPDDFSFLENMWNTCEKLFIHSSTFKSTFLTRHGTHVTYKCLKSMLRSLGSVSEDQTSVMMRKTVFMKKVAIIVSQLRMCMEWCSNSSDKNFTISHLMKNVKDIILQNAPQNSADLKLLCNGLISVSVPRSSVEELLRSNAHTFMHFENEFEQDDNDISTDSSSLESDYTELGYEADVEYVANDAEDGVNKRSRHIWRLPLEKSLAYPQIIVSTLSLIAELDQKTGEIAQSLLHDIISMAKETPANCISLYDENLVNVLLEQFSDVISSEEYAGSVVQKQLLELFMELAKLMFSSVELRFYLNLFKQDKPAVKILLATLATLAENMVMQPTYILTFPALSNTNSTTTQRTNSASSVSSQTASPGIIQTSGSYIVVTHEDALGIAASEKGVHNDKTKPSTKKTSPWTCGSLQLPLSDYLMWTAKSKSFSTSLWLRVQSSGFRMSNPTLRSRSRYNRNSSVLDNSSGSEALGHPFSNYLTIWYQLTQPDPDSDYQASAVNNKAPYRKLSVARNLTDNCLHLFSVGSKEMLVEVWADPFNGSIITRLTSSWIDSNVIEETKIPAVLTPGSWQHLGFMYSESLNKNKEIVTACVTCIVDGCHFRQISMKYQLLQVNPSNASVLIGHSMSDSEIRTTPGSWQMGNFMLFKDCIPKETLFHLYSLGPECSTISQCDSASLKAIYKHFINQDLLLQSGLSFDVLTGNHSIALQHMRESFLLGYLPSHAETYNLYQPQPLGTVKESSKTRLTDIFTSTKPHGFDALLQKPVVMDAGAMAQLVPQIYRGLTGAIDEIGGIGVFIFLYARIVENFQNEDYQAKALKLLFSLIQHHEKYAKEFSHIGGYALLRKVMDTPKCLIGYPTLEVLLNACTSEPIVQYDETNDTYSLNELKYVLVTDTDIISQILLAWRVWDKVDTDIWKMAFTALELMVREDHVHLEFNLKQFSAIDIVGSLLLIFQERIQEAVPSLPIPICDSVVTIIHCMMSSPPDTNMLVTICDFLLLVHPAAMTFVSHTIDGFYFTLKCAEDQAEKQRQKHVELTHSFPASHSTPSLQERYRFDSDSEQYTSYTHLERKMSISCPPSPTLGIGQDVPGSPEKIIVGSADSGSKSDGGTPDRLAAALELYSLDGKKLQDIKNFDEVGAAGSTGSTLLPSNSMDDIWRRAQELMYASTSSESSVDHTRYATRLRRVKTSDSESFVEIDRSSQIHSPEILNPKKQLPFSDTVDQNQSILSDEWEMYPTPTSMKSVRVHVKTQETFDDIEEDEIGLVHVCIGMLKLLANEVVTLPDSLVQKVLGNVIRPEMLVVLAHHNASQIRTAVVKLLASFIQRATPPLVDRFVNQNGFHLLSSQLHQHVATRPLVESCLSIFFGKHHSLHEDMDPSMFLETTSLQKQTVVLAMSLLENTTYDATLCHNTLCMLSQICEAAPGLAGVMLENGLLESLCNTLMAINAINRTRPEICSINGENEKRVLIEDMEHLFSLIAVQSFGTSGIVYQQLFEDVIYMLLALEQSERKSYGNRAEACLTIQSIQYQVFQAVINDISTRFEEPSAKYLDIRRSTTFVPPVTPQSMVSSQRNARMKSIDVGILKNPRLIRPELINIVESSTADEQSSDDTFIRVSHQNWLQIPPLPSSDNTLLLDRNRRRSSLLTEALLIDIQLKKKKNTRIGQNELLERMKKIITLAVDTLIYAVAVNKNTTSLFYGPPSRRDLYDDSLLSSSKFSQSLLEFILRSIVDSLEKKPKSSWKTLIWQAKDTMRIQFCRLFNYMITPESVLDSKIFAIHLLTHEPRCKDIVKITFGANIPQGQKTVVFLHDYITYRGHLLANLQAYEAKGLMAVLGQCGFIPLEGRLSKEQRNSITEDMNNWLIDIKKGKELFSKKNQGAQQRIFHKNDSLSSKVSASAMEVTQDVVNTQNIERKRFIEHIKLTMANGLAVKRNWQHLIQQLTHERGIWFDAKSYPQSWQLDPTEGPFRVRRRLQRCHLGLKEKYLLPDCREKLEAEKYEAPLSYLFDDGDQQSSDSAALIYRLHTNEKIQHTCRSTSVTPSSETSGEILIGETHVYFVADMAILDANYTQVLLGNKDLLSMTWPYDEIKEIHKRRYQLRDIALEIFLTNGKTCLLAFDSAKERDVMYGHLDSMNLQNLIKMENQAAISQLWVEGRMTNYEYITHLNTLAGRTFNDLMQYPVFPFVLSDYLNPVLDLENPDSYRKLNRPIAVQHKDKEKKFKQNYDWLKSEYEKSDYEDDINPLKGPPYHYGSHYSNSGTVLHFLVRLPPFTKMFLSYQDNNFDIPDRSFHSVATSWRLSSLESNTDVKELIPEFFFLPEFLINHEGFDFGHRQSGIQVNDVNLPAWSTDDPRLFIMIHRQALESNYVTQNIHHWIDLVFGFRQTGKPAIDAVNVFHPSTYFGIDVDGIQDSLKRQATITMIKTYGQTPKQLFKSPHLSCASTETSSSNLVTNILFTSSERSSSSTDQDKPIKYKPSPLMSVRGLKWGTYVTSPDCSKPRITWSQTFKSAVTSLYALPTGEVFGLGPCSCLLVRYSKEKGVTTMQTVDCTWAGIISWDHNDGILRIRNKKNHPPVNFIHKIGAEEVTCCASLPDCAMIFIGHNTGVIRVYQTTFNENKKCDIQVKGHHLCLYGHSGPITTLQVCKTYSIMVSASQDGLCIIWDLNRLSYIRSITDHEAPVLLAVISETLGDIASISREGLGSCLQLHTINGDHIATENCHEEINCIAFSTAPEGRSVNLIAGGLSNGLVRLWSTWDLQHVGDIVVSFHPIPVLSLMYSYDVQKLYVSLADGSVVLYEHNPQGKPKVDINTYFDK